MRCTLPPTTKKGRCTHEHQTQRQQVFPFWFPSTDLLPTAIRYEAARAVIFEQWGNFVRANDCLRLKRYYERRAMEECISLEPQNTNV